MQKGLLLEDHLVWIGTEEVITQCKQKIYFRRWVGLCIEDIKNSSKRGHYKFSQETRKTFFHLKINSGSFGRCLGNFKKISAEEM